MALLEGVSQPTLAGERNRWIRFFKKYVHTIKNAIALSSFLRDQSTYDLLLIPTTWTPHVLMLLPLMVFRKDKVKAIRLQFLCCWDVNSIKSRCALRILRIILICANCIHKDIGLFGQTLLVCDDIKGDSALNVTWMPDVAHPVEKTYKKKIYQSDQPLLFGFYGFARHEQGSDILQEAIKEFLKENSDLNVQFHIFWSSGGFYTPTGLWVEPDITLEKTGKVNFYREFISDDQYLSLLGKTDWIILPYLKESYQRRSSRVAVDAIIRGIPAIYTQETFLEELFSKYGEGIALSNNQAFDLAKALHDAYYHYSGRKSQPIQKKMNHLEVFTPEYFWKKLFNY
ncbi:glycosyltransferase [Oscillatoria amoena NRMC-F 0135]|nr:glycosyltransferase [Oscillatoria amoena NRMC-F 0135]